VADRKAYTHLQEHRERRDGLQHRRHVGEAVGRDVAAADGVALGGVKAGAGDDQVGGVLVRDGQQHVVERRQVVACAARDQRSAASLAVSPPMLADGYAAGLHALLMKCKLSERPEQPKL